MICKATRPTAEQLRGVSRVMVKGLDERGLFLYARSDEHGEYPVIAYREGLFWESRSEVRYAQPNPARRWWAPWRAQRYMTAKYRVMEANS